jgi:beta-glucanase (GH16 family)
MRKLNRIIILSLIFLLSVNGLAAQNNNITNHREIKTDDYHLIWQDTFDGNKLDETNNWSIVIDGNSGGNKELQYYRRENIEVGKEPISGENCLIITAKKENYLERSCTSGRLSTQDKVGFKYGKIEARIKAPKTADGLWPAFWMLGIDYPKAVWPKCGEIDIMEMGSRKGILSGVQDRHFGGACHWGEDFNHGKYPNYGKSAISPYCLQDGFHLYTLIWDENAIKMYLDLDKYPANEPYFEMPINVKSVPNESAYYFHKQFFIVFNLAVGGTFSGITNIEQITALKDGEAKMYIDYVKVYQKGETGEEFSMLKSTKND